MFDNSERIKDIFLKLIEEKKHFLKWLEEQDLNDYLVVDVSFFNSGFLLNSYIKTDLSHEDLNLLNDGVSLIIEVAQALSFCEKERLL